MKTLILIIFIIFADGLHAKKKSLPKHEVVKLKKAGVKVKYAKSVWDKVKFPKSMKYTAPDLMLVSKKNKKISRVITTSFFKKNTVCIKEIKKLKKLKFKYRLYSHKKFSCLIKVEKNGEDQYLAIKEVYRRNKKFKLNSQVILVENNSKSLKGFKSWLNKVKRL